MKWVDEDLGDDLIYSVHAKPVFMLQHFLY